MDKPITLCLVGNPNSGKTSLFNAITGNRHSTGNYPGVTVEKKEGRSRIEGHDCRVVDLPGTYNLTSYTAEERITRMFLLEERPDAVICVLDSTNLERNMYLAVQIMEIGMPVVFALNMSDIAARNGIRINTELLSRNTGVPVVFTVGSKGDGMKELLDRAHDVVHMAAKLPLTVNYGREIEQEIAAILPSIPDGCGFAGAPKRWTAIKILEGDVQLIELMKKQGLEKILEGIEKRRQRVEIICGDTIEVLMAEHRYGYISGAVHPVVEITADARHNFSDAVDSILTNRLVGIPIFLAMMYVLFLITFRLGDIPCGWLESFFQFLSNSVQSAWADGSMPMLRSLVVDGVIAGVGGVLSFVPIIIILFIAIALLEDTGYMARAAYLMDRTMRTAGLQGKSFIPMLIGFGCTVPAVMATRTLENDRERLATIFVLPLVSCGARLPVYALLISAFFEPNWQGPMMWFVYIFGILLAVVFARLLKRTVLKGEEAPFVMELPPYRIPTLNGLLLHAWDRSKDYIRKAGTVILAISVILWLLGSLPRLSQEAKVGKTGAEVQAMELEQSILGSIGRALEPVTAPLGFDWKINTALLGASAAKEVFVAQMGIVNALGENEEERVPLSDKLRGQYPAITGLGLILFLLIASPCVATIAVVKKETGKWRFALLQWLTLTLTGYVVALLVHQVGVLTGFL